ncbi:hypothetical protein E1B28_013399 [Marasmius oreades]|uniref:Uncharacterized protein n=1 Tax=Marasmius oreades TaxID=181124 RepID=A0A9P7RQX3_9AGAR|nr:uncharacterized protein E1B28_013399 [Marasmius oreades]KAG7087433.1 hypothetical protein E1B28_013399 [Marasmius oreades]
MFQRFTSALRFGHRHDDEHAGPSKGEVMGQVLEQHPNLSVFHSDSDRPISPSSPPSSPSKIRKHLKRMSKGPEESLRSSSPIPSKLSIGKPKKVRPPLPLNNNSSQLSLGRATPEPSTSFPPTEPSRRPSLDALRSVGNGPFSSIRSRRSIDMLQATPSESLPPAQSPIPAGSVRSILREPNTPGTGQNVRFFSRDAYKVLTPDQSIADIENQAISLLPSNVPPTPVPKDDFPSVVSRASSSPKNARPTIVEVFSRMQDITNQPGDRDQDTSGPDKSLSSMSISEAPYTSNILDFSQDLQLPDLPPGLGFDIDFESGVGVSTDVDNHSQGPMMTSTPYRSDPRKGKGKEREVSVDEDDPLKHDVDEGIFHSKEKSSKMPLGLHHRSQSLSMGQTAFFSMMNGSKRSSTSSVVPSLVSDVKTASATDSPSVSSIRSRSRALSDTVFHSVLRSSPPKPPEEDIYDESSSDVLVYSGKDPEPDPFSANAGTYYTRQTMIPTTPPRGAPTHVRKTSKEDSLIVSLQTQLALQSELCGQYETDLRARDELVDLLSQKLSDSEKEDIKRRGILRAWKKKVAELERACRLLEEEVEGSRQESMERSLMDEASGQALRMLHRQIATLEREKGDVSRREEILREEVETLEGLVRERSEDVLNLKEKLWKQDESQRELQEGIIQANEQMEMLGNVSLCLVDEDELRKQLAEARAEAEQRNEEERAKHHEAETKWESQKTELLLSAENAKAEKISLEGELETLKQQLKNRDDEYTTLKSELEAQWGHAEKASDKIEVLSAEKEEIERERQALEVEKNTMEMDVQNLQLVKGGLEQRCQALETEKGELEKECQDLSNALEELQERVESMELDFNDSENRRNELERQVEALESQVHAGKDSVRYKHEHAEGLAHKLQEREARINELEMECRFNADNVARLEKNIEQRDQEVSALNERVLSQEKEVERISENMTKMTREHTRIVNEQMRDLQDSAMREGEARGEMESLLKSQAEANVVLRTSREKINSLQEEAEKLRRQVHQLQQDSADKEVKIVQLMKGRDRDKEDLNGLNIALDSKQQELELIKRKLSVRGTAGSTPLPTKTGNAHRRDPTIFSTPSTSRPPSVLSDSGRESVASNKERKLSSETPMKNPALARSTRANANPSAFTSKSATFKAGLMGPPVAPTRQSLGTPTPSQRVPSLSRTSSTVPKEVIQHRRPSSTVLDASKIRAAAAVKRAQLGESPPPSDASEKDDKENVDLRSQRRASMIPTPA